MPTLKNPSLIDQKKRAANWAREQGHNFKTARKPTVKNPVIMKSTVKVMTVTKKNKESSGNANVIEVAKQRKAAAEWAKAKGYIDKNGKPTKKVPPLTHDQEMARQKERARKWAVAQGIFTK